MRRRFVAVVTVALASVSAACSGASEKPKTSASVEEDRAAAEKISLKLADFPSGWTAGPHQQTSEEAATLTQYLECLGIPAPATRYTADPRSPDFSQAQAASASSQVRMAKTDADASTDLGAFQSAKGTECFKQTIEKLLPSRLPAGTTTANLTVRQLEFPPLKDGAAAYQAAFTIGAAGGVSLPVYVDSIVFRAGRSEVTLNTTSTGTPFDPKLEEDLAKKMGART